jgi:hypothetical protein
MRRSERAEHEYNPPILAHMGHRLDAAAGEVQIRDLAGPQDGERIHPFRGARRDADPHRHDHLMACRLKRLRTLTLVPVSSNIRIPPC